MALLHYGALTRNRSRVFILALLQSILSQLRSEDESLQLDALNQLNELLAVSMADSLGLYPVEQLIPVLVCSYISFFLFKFMRFYIALVLSWDNDYKQGLAP